LRCKVWQKKRKSALNTLPEGNARTAGRAARSLNRKKKELFTGVDGSETRRRTCSQSPGRQFWRCTDTCCRIARGIRDGRTHSCTRTGGAAARRRRRARIEENEQLWYGFAAMWLKFVDIAARGVGIRDILPGGAQLRQSWVPLCSSQEHSMRQPVNALHPRGGLGTHRKYYEIIRRRMNFSRNSYSKCESRLLLGDSRQSAR